MEASPRDDDKLDSGLSIRLFGEMEVLVRGRPLPRLRSRKGLLLLAHLTFRNGAWVDRSWLAGVLWPESLDEQARASLRQNLADLRRALGPEQHRLQAEGMRMLRLDLEGCDVDCLTFDKLISSGDRSSLIEAVRLARGPLLESLDDETVWQERQTRELVCLDALERLASIDSNAGDYRAAADWSRRLVSLDPLRESAVRSLMTALAELGDYAGVSIAWRDLRARALEDLRQEPSAETTACYRELRARARLRRSPVGAAASRTETSDLTPAGHAGRLPTPLTQLVGRSDALRDIEALFARSRVVTLTGMGGVGKTRLAIQIAWSMLDQYSEGVRYIELAGVADPDHVGQAIASALSVEEAAGTPILETLANAVGQSCMLLVIDNCEHLLDICARAVEMLVVRCPQLRVLATSRQPLGITGEALWQVPSLAVPENDTLSAGRAIDYDAIHLFVERATDAQPGFRLTEENVGDVARICRRLDGIPLALELAAARMRPLTVGQIANRLDHRFDLLSSGNRAALPRQQTLRALVDWSYDLLTESEKSLFRALSVFAGGWTEDAAESVCGEEGEPVFEDLMSLVDKSLVLLQQKPAGLPRYSMLETLRDYAHQKLVEAGDVARHEQRHADWFFEFSDRSAQKMYGPDEKQWLLGLDAEQENMWAALDRGAAGRITLYRFLRLVGSMSNYWTVRGRFSEARQWIEVAIRASAESDDLEGRAQVLGAGGVAAVNRRDMDTAFDLYHQTLKLRRELGDRKGTAGTLNNLALVHHQRNEFESARELYEEALAINREIGNLPWQAINLNNLGVMYTGLCDPDNGQRCLEECLQINRSLNNLANMGHVLHSLGILASFRGENEAAHSRFVESLDYIREMQNDHLIASAELGAAVAACRMGRLDEARDRLRSALDISSDRRDMEVIPYTLNAIAELASRIGNDCLAVTFLGAENSLRSRTSVTHPPMEKANTERQIDYLRGRLAPESFEEAWKKGEEMDLDTAVTQAFSTLDTVAV